MTSDISRSRSTTRNRPTPLLHRYRDPGNWGPAASPARDSTRPAPEDTPGSDVQADALPSAEPVLAHLAVEGAPAETEKLSRARHGVFGALGEPDDFGLD